MLKKLLLASLAASFAVSFACAQAAEKKSEVDISKLPPPSDRKDVTYASDIKSIFDNSCVKCHTGAKAKGKLHLDSLASALKGGEDGNEIVPGNSAKSTLVINIAHLGDEDDYMPPPNNKAHIGPLTNEQIGLIRAWIDQGAK
jgi:mono/diheme cytochrome c family protein